MNKKTAIYCILAIVLSSSLTYYISTNKSAAHAKYGTAIREYISECAGSHITEMYIEKGEQVYSIRCEETADELVEKDVYI
jgi:hypothetical protein